MLLPDNIHPKQSIYYNGAFVLETLSEQAGMHMLDLYISTQSRRQMTMPVFVLCLDWLFLLNLISLDDKGTVGLCS